MPSKKRKYYKRSSPRKKPRFARTPSKSPNSKMLTEEFYLTSPENNDTRDSAVLSDESPVRQLRFTPTRAKPSDKMNRTLDEFFQIRQTARNPRRTARVSQKKRESIFEYY